MLRTVSQAAGTAVGPAAIALVVSTHGPEEWPRVLGMWAFAMAIAPALGLLTGGPAVEALSWRGLFAAQGLAAVAVVVVAARALPETPRGGASRSTWPARRRS